MTKFFNITFNYLYATLFPKVTQTDVELPKRINTYKLVRDLQYGKKYPFRVGLYKDIFENNLVVIKIWVGKRKDMYYYNLLHEIEVTQVLSNVRKRMKAIPLEVENIYTPKFIGSSISKNKVIFISEYMDGEKLSKWIDIKKQRIYYDKCVSYLRFIGQHCTAKERKIIREKSILNYVLIYPLIWGAAFVKNFGFGTDLLYGLIIFIKGLPALLSNKEDLVFVHGDLNSDNIIINGDKISIIDTEQTNFTYPQYEVITLLSSRRNRKDFINNLLSEIEEKCTLDSRYKVVFSGLMVYCQTYNLTGSLYKENVKVYKKRLKFGILTSHMGSEKKTLNLVSTDLNSLV